MKKYLTFNTKGLKKYEIDFLADIEKRWLKGEAINRDLMYKVAVKHKGTPKAKGILEAFKYWEFMPKPIIRESAVKPVKLSELLMLGGSYHLTDTKTHESWKVSENTIISELNLMLLDLPYYYQITNGNLWLKYETIIGQRFIARITNDFKN